jgi:hypothetical protein
MVEAHVAMARVAVEALGLLTDGQLEQLQTGMQMLGGMVGPGEMFRIAA